MGCIQDGFPSLDLFVRGCSFKSHEWQRLSIAILFRGCSLTLNFKAAKQVTPLLMVMYRFALAPPGAYSPKLLHLLRVCVAPVALFDHELVRLTCLPHLHVALVAVSPGARGLLLMPGVRYNR